MDNLSTLLKAAFPCLPISPTERAIQLPTETSTLSEKFPATQPRLPIRNTTAKISATEAADSIVSAMLAFEPLTSPSLPTTVNPIVHQAGGWSEYLAAKILAALQTVLEAGKPLNEAVRSAYDVACRAVEVTEGFAADHPVFCTLVALGVLVVLAPYVVEYLGFCAGFGELGPVEGMSGKFFALSPPFFSRGGGHLFAIPRINKRNE